MHLVKIHKVIGLITYLFYRIGFWHRGDKPTVKEKRIKSFYCVYYALFVLALVVGVFINDKKEEAIFLAEISMGVAVVWVKLCILIWKQDEILHLLDRVCVFSIRYDDDHNRVNGQLQGFAKFASMFAAIVTVGGCLDTVLPLLKSERNLFYEIAFPLDYKSSEIAFWIAFVYLFTESCLTIIILNFTIVIWYLLVICSLRYEVLGSEIRNLGQISENRKMVEWQRHIHFFGDLKASIDAHLHLRELVTDVESFFSEVFLIQFAISGLCICGSIFCLAFDIGDNLLERFTYVLVFCYFISELFMITYFGNEIMLSSDRFSYCLFESDWYNQPQSTKKCVIIFGEYLKQPQELVIGKLYPLTLETFTRILNSAYSMFNILKSFQ